MPGRMILLSCLAITLNVTTLDVAGNPALAGPPNIVLILADDLGYRALGCYGQEQIQTPHLDRLARAGMKFTRAYAGAHVCQPSRSALMTGQHTGHTPVRANDTRQFLLEHDITIPELLKERGYVTGGFGKWGLGYEGTSGHPNRQGFDDYFGVYLQVHAHFYYPFWVWHNEQKVFLEGNLAGRREQYVQDEFNRQALQFIREHHQRPFFAYIPYIIPHVELVVPDDSEMPYRGKFPVWELQDSRPGYISSSDGLTTFAGMVSRLDRHAGQVLDLLDELGIAENTVVLFTSDNGAQGGGVNRGWARMNDYFRTNGPLRDYKGSFYEGGLRVPLIVRWPGHVPPASTSDHPVAFWDFLPTLAEIAGARLPEAVDGVSFLPTLTGTGQQQQAEGLYWEYPAANGIGRAASIGRWKAVQARPDRPVELYDLEQDEGETNDVAALHPDVLLRLIDFMNRSHQEPRPPAGPGVASGVHDYVQHRPD